jgi:hypothetical protein
MVVCFYFRGVMEPSTLIDILKHMLPPGQYAFGTDLASGKKKLLRYWDHTTKAPVPSWARQYVTRLIQESGRSFTMNNFGVEEIVYQEIGVGVDPIASDYRQMPITSFRSYYQPITFLDPTAK